MDTRMSVNEQTRRSTVGMAVLLSIGVVVSSVMANKVAAAEEPLSLLDRRGKIELRHAHFVDVVQYYTKYFGIEIRFDAAAIEELGIDLDNKEKDLTTHRKAMIAQRESTENRLKRFGVRTSMYAELLKEIESMPYPGLELVADDISLHSALMHILRGFDPELSYRIVDNLVEITSLEVISENLETRIFKVEDLVRWEQPEPTGPFAPVPQETSPEFLYDYDPLIEILTTTVDSDSWEEAGGEGQISEGRHPLVISQTPRVLRCIEAMLAALRNAKTRSKRKPDDRQVQGGNGHLLQQSVPRSGSNRCVERC